MAIRKISTPAAIGAPAKFRTFRDQQLDAIRQGTTSRKRFVVQAMPTGSGKSLNAITQALATSARAVYLTSTKGLQDQLLDDFEEIGLTDVRGMGNYKCIEVSDRKVTVDEGPCFMGQFCSRREHTHDDGTVVRVPPGVEPCHYFNAVKLASGAELVLSNYAYWMHHSSELGEFDLLILDEAHNVIDELSSFLSIEITSWEIETLLGSSMLGESATTKDWRIWGREHYKNVGMRISDIKKAVQRGSDSWQSTRAEVRKLRQINTKLDRLLKGKDRVCEVVTLPTGVQLVKFDVVWPQDQAESVLFRDIPRVLLMSATVRPKTAQLLGIDPDELDFHEYEHTFPKANRPIHCVDTARLSARSTPGDWNTWVRRIDQIINRRTDRKGVIHTGSYARRDLLLSKSEHAPMMVTHDKRNTAEVVASFQASPHPQILVSPSVTTGYDFPGSQCEYQIIGKVPFPDMRPAVMKARKKRDREYDMFVTMQQIVQAAGRGIRSATDQCEVFVIDDHFKWFIRQYKHLCPVWFYETVQRHATIPHPPVAMLNTNNNRRERRST